MRPLFHRFALAVVALAGLRISAAERSVLPLVSDWRFLRGEAAQAAEASFDDTAWKGVTLPHTFTPGDPPPKDYYRGPGWYRRHFATEAGWSGRRVFVRFEAASLVADVYLNGRKLGEHRGGFAAFCYELTSGLAPAGEQNVLAVRVDNTRREDVIPLGGDFTIYGGLYRPAELIVTGPVAITPLDHGSPGVFLRPSLGANGAWTVDGTAEIAFGAESGATAREDVRVRMTLFDAAGSRQSTAESGIKADRGHIRLSIVRPRLWDGVQDPYLYRVRADVLVRGQVVDSLDQPVGFRTLASDPRRGYLLNGRPLQIHGVDRHQDWAGVGWAASEAQQDTDIRLMREMGVTGVRLSHYQQSEFIYRRCDETGLLVWTELPMVNDVRGTPAFLANAREQLTELIRQNLNHPSVVMWSLYNEISPTYAAIAPGIVGSLKELARAEDPSRPTTGALSIDGIAKLHAVGELNDLVALNVYPGWYLGRADDMGPILDRWNAAYGSRGLIVSEYGAGASVRQHQEDYSTRPPGRAPREWHPEEWQAFVHERTYAAIRARPFVYGSFIWNMFDFASAGRREGDTPGINDKGLVTRDRRTRKDAFYFYQANWTTRPMAHIVGGRDSVRASAQTAVKVYANAGAVTLWVNGASQGSRAPDDLRIARWPAVRLRTGPNVIEARTDTGASDRCEWTLSQSANPL